VWGAIIVIVAIAAVMKLRTRSGKGSPATPEQAVPPPSGHAQELIPCEGSTEDIANWIWRHLVPRAGQAGTVQGELLRAVEKLRDEAQRNGNINWNDSFEKLIDFLHEQLVRRSTLPDARKLSVLADLGRLRNYLPVDQLEDDSQAGMLPYVDDDLYDRLTDAVVEFCCLNRVLIPHTPDPELHC
jgi:hypothetical protein